MAAKSLRDSYGDLSDPFQDTGGASSARRGGLFSPSRSIRPMIPRISSGTPDKREG